MAWVSPTGHSDPDTEWTDEAQAYNDDTGNYAYDDVASKTFSSPLILTVGAIDCNKVRLYVYSELGVDLDYHILYVYYGGAYHQISFGAITEGVWVEKNIGSTQSVTRAKIILRNGNASTTRHVRVHDFDFYQVEAGDSGGETKVKRRVKLTPYRLLDNEAAGTAVSLVYRDYR